MSDMGRELMQAAFRAREHAYAPYSKFRVGAAVLDATGAVTPGCNVENVAYGPTICAERVALTSAVAAGLSEPVAVAVASESGVTPCGVCRQVMMELGPGMRVFLGDAQGNIQETTVQALLPSAFNAADLPSAEGGA